MPLPPRRLPRSHLNKVLIGAAVAVVPALIAGFVALPRSPLDLGKPGNLASAHLLKHWAAGDVMVLVRHVERCDRAGAPCLSTGDGITQAGSVVAARIGDGFRTLGLTATDIISSPTMRTAQTGHFMFGEASQNQEWLRVCIKTSLLNEALAHKQPHRNLVLITHSDCISKLEAQLDYSHAAASEYGTAFFISVHNDGKISALGILNPDGWQTALQGVAK